MMGLESVSRETIVNLREYQALILKWSSSINLIARSTRTEVWDRHILDCAKLLPLIPFHARSIVDIGSGAGLPGLVVAILVKERNPDTVIYLIESDTRKAAFLRNVSIYLSLNTQIIADRIENADKIQGDVVTARALAPLPKLLSYVQRNLSEKGTALLLKGKEHSKEVAEAKRYWDFDLNIIPDKDTMDSVVLELKNLRERVPHE